MWPFSTDFMCEGLILEVIQGLNRMQISLNLHLQLIKSALSRNGVCGGGRP